jgi:hypothetical protein
MRSSILPTLVLALALAPPCPARGSDGSAAAPFPPTVGAWKAVAPPSSFDRKSVYDELDGGAEVYLEYGLRSLVVQRYEAPGVPEITLELFEMDDPAGAFGAFTFEREDEGAGIGQGSEYGGGLLRFWQGRTFGFVQTERETSASKEAVLALGRTVASKLGPPGREPAIVGALPLKDQRPRSLRFALSPLLLAILDPRMQGNPLGLPARCEVVMARYGAKGSPERILVARFPDVASAQKGLENLIAMKFPAGAKPADPSKGADGFAVASRLGPFVIVVTGAPDALAALKRLEATMHRAEEVRP